MKTIYLAGIALVLSLVAFVIFALAPRFESVSPAVTNFDECVAAGNPVMPARTTEDVQSGGESYPRQCNTPEGQHFVEEISPINDPIQFNGCAVAGCSSQLCVSAEEAETMVTTCEYRAEYACYQEAHCGQQVNGKCGWSDTAELRACLSNPPMLTPGADMEAVY